MSLNPLKDVPIPKHEILLAYSPDEIIVTFKPSDIEGKVSATTSDEELPDSVDQTTPSNQIIKKIGINKELIIKGKHSNKKSTRSHEMLITDEPEPSLSTINEDQTDNNKKQTLHHNNSIDSY